LSFSTDVLGSVVGAEVVFLCLPTPQGDDGSADLSYIEAVARQIGPHLAPGTVVVNKSTVPVGSSVQVGQWLGRTDVFVVSNPEFLRQGTALQDFFTPRVWWWVETMRPRSKRLPLYMRQLTRPSCG
jgi:UDPglucose 6-dehydrogenase